MNAWNAGFEYKKVLGADAAGLPLIEYLTRSYPAFTREQWAARIDSGRVLLDGAAVQEQHILEPGRLLSYIRPPWKEPEAPRSFGVLYRDDHVLAVAKPRGLPTLPGGGYFLDNTLLSLVRRHFPKANPLHRLGRGTSGIVLFALTREAAGKISKAWNTGDVLKIYRALVAGSLEKDDFPVDVPIGPVPHPILKTVYGASLSGKRAHSQIRVLERRGSCTLIEVKISTGRPHQIRIHLAAAGHPLAGDPLYIAGGIPAEGSRALPSDLGYHLHNELLGFPHPRDGKWTEIFCSPPPVLRLCSKAENAGY